VRGDIEKNTVEGDEATPENVRKKAGPKMFPEGKTFRQKKIGA